jgi:hypothetical protein
MTETIVIAYSLKPLIEEAKKLPREKQVDLILEREKKNIEQRFTTKEEFEKWLTETIKYMHEIPPEKLERAKEELIKKEVEKAVRGKILEEINEIEKNWSTKKAVYGLINYFRAKGIPFVEKAFKDVANKEVASKEIRNVPFAEYELTFVIPDFEEAVNLEKLEKAIGE